MTAALHLGLLRHRIHLLEIQLNRTPQRLGIQHASPRNTARLNPEYSPPQPGIR